MSQQQLLSRFFKSSQATSSDDAKEVIILDDGDVDNKPASPAKEDESPSRSRKLQKFKLTNSIDSSASKPITPKPSKKRKSKIDATPTTNNDFSIIKASSKRQKTTSPPKQKKLTPLEQQFINLKKQNMDKVLAVQVGYKYKFFAQDAVIASNILNIMLIPGKKSIDIDNPPLEDGNYDKFAYCSIPDVRLHVHLKRLLHRGLKVGVVDQIDPLSLKSTKLFERTCSRVYTLSTYIDDTIEAELGKRSGNFILCLKENSEGNVAIIGVNIYSGDIVYDEFEDDSTRSKLETRLDHLDPIEFLIIGELSKDTQRAISNFNKINTIDRSMIRSEKRQSKLVSEYLCTMAENFNAEALEFLNRLSPSLQGCFCELENYMNEFNLAGVFRIIDNFKHFSKMSSGMVLNSDTLRSLEIFKNLTNGTEKGSLFWLLDHTNTGYGSRLLKQWIGRPLMSREEIMKRIDAIECILRSHKGLVIERCSRVLQGCPDLEIGLNRIHYQRTKRKEVYLFLKKWSEIFDSITGLRDDVIASSIDSHYLRDIIGSTRSLFKDELKEFNSLLGMIFSPSAMDEQSDSHASAYFTKEFFGYAKIQEKLDDIEDVESQLNDELIEIRKIIKKPHSSYITKSNEPYLIEVKNSEVKRLPADWTKINGTVHVSRFRSPTSEKLYQQKQLQQKLLNVAADEAFQKFLQKIDESYLIVHRVIKNLATLDCLLSLSVASTMNENYNRPTFVDQQIIHLVSASNPIVQALKVNYVPNTFTMTKESGRVAVITGPNMGGKSSFIRQVALIVVMAQIGCYIPAGLNSKLGIFDSIFIRMGAHDDIIKNQSTFQVEMTECSLILDQCTSKSLVLLDEIGRGTSTVDGYAIAYSILDYLSFGEGIDDVKPFVLFITHYQKLQNFAKKCLSYGKGRSIIKNYHLGFKMINDDNSNDEDIMFTYRLTPGGCDRSYGINCAKLSGLPKEITDPAGLISGKFETDCDVKRFWNLIDGFDKYCSVQGDDQKDLPKLWELIDDLE